ncbi:hypothetical protein REPUB_Repub11eG0181900 [Reevesia pubescens]
MDASKNYPLDFPNNFELHDFIDDPNFDQFINLIRGEKEDGVAGFDYDFINGCFVNKPISSIPDDGDAFGFDATSTMVPDPNYISSALPSFDGEIMKDAKELDTDDDEDNSSGTTTTTATKKAKGDRSRTLISERRRGRMKEKLYALRSLVPNITKLCLIYIYAKLIINWQDERPAQC